MGIGTALRRFGDSSLADAFLLRSAERTTAAYPKDRFAKVVAFFKAGERRARAADELLEGQAAVALTLYREAALLFMAAALTSRPDTIVNEPLKSDEIVTMFRSYEKDWPCPRPKAELDYFLGLVASPDLMVFDKLPPADAFERTKSVRHIVGWLRELIQPRSVQEIRTQRMVRLTILGVVLFGGLTWALVTVLKPKNIALHKPVTTSSVYPTATSPPSGFTDGVTSGSYGVATNQEEHPWAVVDLLDVYRLSKIKIYNRGDGWYDEALPMTIELSENGTDYVEVDKRTLTFGQWFPWTYSAGGKKARYIRVRGTTGKWVTLSELEAFGSK